MRHEPVRLHGPSSDLAVAGVLDLQRPSVARRLGDEQEDVGLVGRRGVARTQVSHLEQRVDLRSEVSGEHPAHLARRGVGREGGHLAPGLRISREQAQQHGERLVAGQHERRHPVPGHQAVAAVRPPDGLDRHVQVEQVRHVAPDGARVDAEAFGEVGGLPHPARLQDLQEGQDTGGRSNHWWNLAAYRAGSVRYRS